MSKDDVPVIATRILHIHGSEQVATVSLRAPIPDQEGDWVCSYSITGLAKPLTGSAHGIDSIQALIMALEGLHGTLAQTGESFSWEGGDGEAGFPRIVPMVFGPEFSTRIEGIIDTEVAIHTEWLEQRLRHSNKIA